MDRFNNPCGETAYLEDSKEERDSFAGQNNQFHANTMQVNSVFVRHLQWYNYIFSKKGKVVEEVGWLSCMSQQVLWGYRQGGAVYTLASY